MLIKKRKQKMKLVEAMKAVLKEQQPNFCNKMRAYETGEFKNFTDEECYEFMCRNSNLWQEVLLKQRGELA